MQWKLSLPWVVYVLQRNMLVQTQGYTAMQIYLYNFQIVAGSYPTTLEFVQNKFLSACKPRCRHNHSPGFLLAVFSSGNYFRAPPCKLWKAVAECTAVTFSKLFHSSIDFLTLLASASGLWSRGRMPASKNYRILKRLNQSSVFITIFNKCC